MRARLAVRGLTIGLVALTALGGRASAQDAPAATSRFADGLVPGDYLRIGGSSVGPINPSGSLKDWNRGVGFGLQYENWDIGRDGVGRLGYVIMADYSLLPFNSQHFIQDFTPPTGKASSASAKDAGVFQFGVGARFRIPSPLIMPSISIGLGFIDWHPGQITYTNAAGTQSAKQEHRSGGSISIGAGLDKQIYDRFAIFGEAIYAFGYTSFGQGLAASGSTCITSDCDLLKNTPLGIIRGGLRIRVNKD